MKPMIKLDHPNPARADYVKDNGRLVSAFEPQLALTDSRLRFDGFEIIITDQLCRLVTCGKLIESLEVVTIYNAWTTAEKTQPRAPIYLIHFAGLSEEEDPSVSFDRWLAHSYATHESKARGSSSESSYIPLSDPENTIEEVILEGMDKEIRYNLFLRLDRRDTHFCLPQLLDTTQQKAVQLRAADPVIKETISTYPIPCLSTSKDCASILLHGYFSGDAGTMAVKLESWLKSSPGQREQSSKDVYGFIHAHTFLFVDDTGFKDASVVMSDQWRDRLQLKDGWFDALARVLGTASSKIDSLSDAFDYGQLLEKARQL